MQNRETLYILSLKIKSVSFIVGILQFRTCIKVWDTHCMYDKNDLSVFLIQMKLIE